MSLSIVAREAVTPSIVASRGPQRDAGGARCAACPGRAKGLCAAVPTPGLRELAATARPEAIPSGRAVFHEGDEATTVLMLASGMLKLYKSLPDGRQQIIGFATVGDVVGLSANGVHRCSAEAVTESSACRLLRATLDGWTRSRPALRDRLLSMASFELQAAQEQILLLGCKSASERLATFLAALARRSRSAADAKPVAFLPMQKTDVGGYLGMRPETISRNFRKFEDAGLITRLSPERVRVDDLEALESLATPLD